MSDVAVLGLVVDSTQVTKATAALDGLAAAAKPAAAASGSLGNAAAVAAKQAEAHSESLRGQRMVLRGLVGDLALFGSGLGQAAGIAATLYIENAHLVGGFGGLKNAIASVLTPTNLMIGGFVGLVAGSALALNAWKNFALQLDDTAHIAGTTSSAMAQLQAAASFKGINQADFTKGIESFSALVYQARNNMGSLVEVLRANGVSAAGDFTAVFGKAADLIKHASSDQQRLVLLQQMGLPATMDWVRFMSQGAAGIRQATDEAVRFGGAANDQMVAKARAFDDTWNKAWTNFGLGWRSAVVSAAGGIDYLIMKGRAALFPATFDGLGAIGRNMIRAGNGTSLNSASDVSSFYGGIGALKTTPGKTGDSVDKDALRQQISIAQPRLGSLGKVPRAPAEKKPAPEPERKEAA